MAEAEAKADAAGVTVPRLPVAIIQHGIQTVPDLAVVAGNLDLLDKAIENVKATAATMIASLEYRRDCIKHRYGLPIAAVTRRAIAEQPGTTKSIKFLTGLRVGFNRVPGNLEIVDPKAAMKWARKNKLADAIKRTVKSAPVAATFKAYYEDTGETPDGCKWVPAYERCKVGKNTVHEEEV